MTINDFVPLLSTLAICGTLFFLKLKSDANRKALKKES